MRIIHTIATLAAEAGGPSRTVPLLCEALARRGADVHVVTLRPGGADVEMIIPDPALVQTHFVASGQGFWPARFVRQIVALARADGSAVVNDNGIWLPANVLAAVAAHRARAPLVITVHGMLTPWAMRHKRARKQVAWYSYQRKALRSAAVLHTTAPVEADEVGALLPGQPVMMVPNGTEIPAWRELPPPGARRRMLFLSRIHPKKGLPDLVRAWAAVRPAGWEVAIAGPDEGGHEKEVRDLVRQHGLDGQFVFLGPVSDVDKWEAYRASDLFVLPTYSENFGVVVAEALACGVPVLTTHGAPWEMLLTERCGWWVAPGVGTLATALREATQTPGAALREMGRRGRRAVEARFSWDSIAADMLSHYEQLAPEGTRR